MNKSVRIPCPNCSTNMLIEYKIRFICPKCDEEFPVPTREGIEGYKIIDQSFALTKKWDSSFLERKEREEIAERVRKSIEISKSVERYGDGFGEYGRRRRVQQILEENKFTGGFDIDLSGWGPILIKILVVFIVFALLAIVVFRF